MWKTFYNNSYQAAEFLLSSFGCNDMLAGNVRSDWLAGSFWAPTRGGAMAVRNVI